MSKDSIKSLLCRYYEEVVSTGEIDRVEEFIAPGREEGFDGKRYSAGIEGAKAHILGGRMVGCRIVEYGGAA